MGIYGKVCGYAQETRRKIQENCQVKKLVNIGFFEKRAGIFPNGSGVYMYMYIYRELVE